MAGDIVLVTPSKEPAMPNNAPHIPAQTVPAAVAPIRTARSTEPVPAWARQQVAWPFRASRPVEPRIEKNPHLPAAFAR